MNLEVLDLSGNRTLRCIPAGVFRLPKLMGIHVNGCESLTSPPEAVSKQELSAVRKYFSDLDKGGKRNFIPVTVIGRSMVFHDFGGQAIYHFAYPLSTRSQFIPMLVIDIAAFDKLAKSDSVDTACEKVCFDWLSHLYLSCPQAGPPFIVLTHRDTVSAPVFKKLKEQLISATESLRMKIMREEKVMAPGTSPFFSMASFCDEAQPLLAKHRLMTFYKSSGEKLIASLKNALMTIGLPLVTELPDNWCELMDLCLTKDAQPYLTLEELDVFFSDEGDRVILQFLHEIGRVMWYKNRPPLAGIVFHRIELLTKVV